MNRFAFLPGKPGRWFALGRRHRAPGLPGPCYECSNPIHQRARQNGNRHHRRRLFLVRRSRLPTHPRRQIRRFRLCRRHGGQSQLRAGLHRHDRPRRSDPAQIRSRRHLLRQGAGNLLGSPRPHHPEPAGQRHRHAIPLHHPLQRRRAEKGRRSLQGQGRQAISRTRLSPRLFPSRRFIPPRIITRITTTRTRTQGLLPIRHHPAIEETDSGRRDSAGKE